MNGHPGVASRYNPVIRVFYQRLLAAGKPKKLALTACMRKLLTIVPHYLCRGEPSEFPSAEWFGWTCAAVARAQPRRTLLPKHRGPHLSNREPAWE